MSKNDGGAAFPNTPTDRSGQIAEHEWGMSLRDYHIAHSPVSLADALLQTTHYNAESVGMLAKEQRIKVFEKLAEMRGEYADAMLAERSKS